MLDNGAGGGPDQNEQVSRVIAEEIRNLHTAAFRDLDQAAVQIIGKVEAFREQGLVSSEVARQLIFDVRNERSRISR
ncbi:hypothetical protein [Pseudomonas rhizosphaerae]|jgi:hypothetical protein|uniref:Uncharacterized protein n=1 Tax=Pseudomonas rhizosphaerae TaxID=216142 RepID=A0A089YU96_9PSED|nr:hypothetical protein [Pseudomonas rhizosphaerae]AIS17947.1 hypothetical protein LT40_11350 [Pseudomonas rhizosphaerae]MBD8614018.1 hypothetical protein [Pseudomonas putida]MEB2870054.1 hypothetical protein [Pseudomonas rhizosphaerae]